MLIKKKQGARVGHRWKKGESGNSSGRPKGSLSISDKTNCIEEALSRSMGLQDRREAIFEAIYQGGYGATS